MLFFSDKLGCRSALLGLLLALLSVGFASHLNAQEKQPPLIERQEFDRITLNAANGGKSIDVAPLDLPGGKVPEVLPETGQLEVKRLSEPSVPYYVSWSSIAKIERYNQLLLNEADRLVDEKKFVEAYDYLLKANEFPPKPPGLQKSLERYLVRDAAASHVEQRYDEALLILNALYELNPQYPGLGRIVGKVSDRLIEKHLASQDFATARKVLDLLIEGFPQLEITSIATWKQKFETDASRQLALAKQAMQAGDFSKARRAVMQARGILPEAAGARELITEINRLSPRIVVGVSQLASPLQDASLQDWSAARLRRLRSPQLIELVDFGAEGGIYDCRWGELAISESGLDLEVRLNEESRAKGITPEAIALELLRMADPTSPTYLDGFQDMLADVGIGKGQALSIHWRISHVRPEALFRLPLDQLAGTQDSLVAYQAFQEAEQPDVIRYSVPSQEAADEKMPTVVEQSFATEEEAISALIRKDVDVLSRISPWQVERLRRSEDLVVDSYRVPSVHVLIPNHSKPLLARREFRRALCYGIDRQQVLEQFILGGKKDAGFRVLSGPFPSGANRTDPVGYAYNQTIQPHPYEPRLGAVLSRVARTTLAKMAALKEEKESAEVAEEEATEKKVPEKKELPPPEPLLLVYPPEPVARTVCQTMKLQLDAIGIPIKLHELSPTSKELPANYDLFYAELAMWEPAVDAKRLLGPKGLAGSCTATMSLALQSIDTAQNWDQVRTRFRQVHKVAFGDLPVIPLWQTTNYFAYRRAVAGIGASPVSLYQDLPDWKINLDEVGP